MSVQYGRYERIPMIETYAYARAGLLGNPSDGYFGKTIASRSGTSVRECRCTPAPAWRSGPPRPTCRCSRTSATCTAPRVERLLRRHPDHPGADRPACGLLPARGNRLPDRNFTLEYESTSRFGSGWGAPAPSSPPRFALCASYFDFEIPLPVQANLVLETETKELGVPAGPQNSVVQAYEGWSTWISRANLWRRGVTGSMSVSIPPCSPTFMSHTAPA